MDKSAFRNFESIETPDHTSPRRIGTIQPRGDGTYSVSLSVTRSHWVDYYGEAHTESELVSSETVFAETLDEARAIARKHVGEQFQVRTPYGVVGKDF